MLPESTECKYRVLNNSPSWWIDPEQLAGNLSSKFSPFFLLLFLFSSIGSLDPNSVLWFMPDAVA